MNEYQEALKSLQEELDEGDITAKGFEKKKKKLLEKFSYLFESQDEEAVTQFNVDLDSPDDPEFTGVPSYYSVAPNNMNSIYSIDSMGAEYHEALYGDQQSTDPYFARQSYIQDPSIHSDDSDSVIDLTVSKKKSREFSAEKMKSLNYLLVDKEKEITLNARPHSDFFNANSDIANYLGRFNSDKEDVPDSPFSSEEQSLEESVLRASYPDKPVEYKEKYSPVKDVGKSGDFLGQTSNNAEDLLLEFENGVLPNEKVVDEFYTSDGENDQNSPKDGKGYDEQSQSSKSPQENSKIAPELDENNQVRGIQKALPLINLGESKDSLLVDNDLFSPISAKDFAGISPSSNGGSSTAFDKNKSPATEHALESLENSQHEARIKNPNKTFGANDTSSRDEQDNQSKAVPKTGKKLTEDSQRRGSNGTVVDDQNFNSSTSGSGWRNNRNGQLALPGDGFSKDMGQNVQTAPIAHVRKQSLDKESSGIKVGQPIVSPLKHQNTASLNPPAAYQYENGRRPRSPSNVRPPPSLRAPLNYPPPARGYPNNFQNMSQGVAPSNFTPQFRYPPQEYQSRPPPNVHPVQWQNPQYQYSGRPQNLNLPPVPGPPNRMHSNVPGPQFRPSPAHASLSRQGMGPGAFSSRDNSHVEIYEYSSALLKPEPVLKDLTEDISGKTYSEFQNISSILNFRASHESKTNFAFSVADSRLKHVEYFTYESLHLKAVRYATYLTEILGCLPGSSVGLLFRQNEYLEFLGALFGCFYCGVIAVPVSTYSFNSSDEFLEIIFVLSHSKSSVAIVGDSSYKSIGKFLSKKDFHQPSIHWAKISEIQSFRKNEELNLELDLESLHRDIAYLEYTKSSSGDLKGVAMSHKVIMNQCRILKSHQSIDAEDILLTCMELRQGFGLLFGVFLAVYSGFHAVTVPNDICQIPGLWLLAVSRFRPSICLAQPVDLLTVMGSVGNFVPGRKEIIDLSSIKSLFIETTSPNPDFAEDFTEALTGFGLAGQSVFIPILSLQEFGGVTISVPQSNLRNKGYANPNTVFIDTKSAMDSKVSVLSITQDIGSSSMENNTTGIMRITDSGNVLREGLAVIVDPETSIILPPNSIGELLVCSSDNLPEYFWALPIHTEKYMKVNPVYISGKDESNSLGVDADVQIIPGSDKVFKHTVRSSFIRTGLLGFILDKNSNPPRNDPVVYVVSKKHDVIVQKAALNMNAADVHVPRQHFYSNHLSKIFHKLSYGIEASVFFNLGVHDDYVTILLLEVSRNDDNGALLQKILKFALLNLNLKIFSILICAPGSLQRLLPGKNVETLLHTSYWGFSSDVIYSAVPPTSISKNDRSYFSAKRRLLITEHLLCNVEVCKKAFISGNIWTQIGYLNCIPQVIGSIIFHRTIYDDLMFKRDPRPAQIICSYRNVNIMDDSTGKDLHGFPTISHLLEWRVNRIPDQKAYVLLDSRGRESKVLTYKKFSQKAYAIAAFLRKKFAVGTHVVIMMTLSLEFMITIHACLYCGLIPIPISPPDVNRLKEDIPALIAIMGEFQVTSFLVNAPVDEDLRGRVISAAIRAGCTSDSEVKVAFPEILLVTKVPRVNKEIAISDQLYHNMSMVSLSSNPAIILVSYSPDMQISINALSHSQIIKECIDQITQHNMLRSVQGDNSFYSEQQPSSRPLLACVRSFNGLGFLFSTVLGIYCGSFTLVLSPFDYFLSPHIWFDTIYRYSVKDAFATYLMLEHALSTLTDVQFRSFSLHNLENLIVYTDGRSKPEVDKLFIEKMAASRFDPEALCVFYSTNVHPMVATRSFCPSRRAALWVNTEALKRNLVNIVHESYGVEIYNNITPKEDALMLLDLGLPCQDSSVAIVNPETWCICGPGECGEIWVSSTWNCPGYSEGFAIKNLDTQFRYYRTGDRGFLWPVPKVPDGEESQLRSGWKAYFEGDKELSLALFVIGPYSRELILNGMRYPIDDLERTVESCSPFIPVGGCIIFPHNSTIICAVEIDKPDNMIITSNQITLALLKRHRFSVDTIAFVQAGLLAKSRMKEKQRSKVAIAYHLGKLPIEGLIHTH